VQDRLLPDAKTCYRYLQAGFSIIILTFLVGVLVLAIPDLRPICEVIVMPALFVGLGFPSVRHQNSSAHYAFEYVPNERQKWDHG
jgi:hypothetical protein